MELFGIDIIEHPNFSEDEAWIILKKDAPQVPDDLRDNLPVPCILTGNLALTKRTLNLLQAISVGSSTLNPSHRRPSRQPRQPSPTC